MTNFKQDFLLHCHLVVENIVFYCLATVQNHYIAVLLQMCGSVVSVEQISVTCPGYSLWRHSTTLGQEQRGQNPTIKVLLNYSPL